ncbi:hypothetical protein GDO81_021323 [Engystomops pustulosus]|uniref:Uncharacterized protein n=1 Tax=Engystomops pustulosus TaxID=76066 RepID=A0AAV6ZSX8_ENGPU|nr:hypothetical protein GDO81_021323 [Engystomops pustulosus]
MDPWSQVPAHSFPSNCTEYVQNLPCCDQTEDRKCLQAPGIN